MLIVVPVVWSVEVPVCETRSSAINPGKGALVQEVGQPNVSSVRVSEGGERILLRLVLDGGKSSAKSDARGERDQVVGRA